MCRRCAAGARLLLLALDPHLCAIEGIGGAQTQPLIGGGKRPQTVVVGIAEAIDGDGLEVYAVLCYIKVEAALCLAHIVQKPDSAGDVAHRNVAEHESVGELDGLRQSIGIAAAIGVYRFQRIHQGLQVVPLRFPLLGGALEQIAVDELP